MKRTERVTWSEFSLTITVRGGYQPDEERDDRIAEELAALIFLRVGELVKQLPGAEVEFWPR